MSSRSAYIPLHGDVFSNKKTIAAANELTKGDVEKMVGHLARLWTWAVERNDDGNLSHLSDQMIAEAAGWRGRPTRFVEAITVAGFLEGGHLHDWNDYAGALRDRRARDRERKRAARQASDEAMSAGQSVGHPQDSPRDVRAQRNGPDRNGTDRKVPDVDGSGASGAVVPSGGTTARGVRSTRASEDQVREAVGSLVAIAASGDGLYDCVLTPREAETLVRELIAEEGPDKTFDGIRNLADQGITGFTTNTVVGQTKGVRGWVRLQKTGTLVDGVRALMEKVDRVELSELFAYAGVPDDGIEHASTDSLLYLRDVLEQKVSGRYVALPES